MRNGNTNFHLELIRHDSLDAHCVIANKRRIVVPHAPVWTIIYALTILGIRRVSKAHDDNDGECIPAQLPLDWRDTLMLSPFNTAYACCVQLYCQEAGAECNLDVKLGY